MAAKTWEQKTCGKVNVVEFPFGELYPKYLTAMTAGESTFDVITFAPAWMPDFSPYLSEMPAVGPPGQGLGGHRPGLSRPADGVGRQAPVADHRRRPPHPVLPQRPVRRPEGEGGVQGQVRLRPGRRRRPGRNITTSPSSSPGPTRSCGARRRRSGAAASSSGSSSPMPPATPTTRRTRAACSSTPRRWTRQVNNPGWAKALEDYIKSVEVLAAGRAELLLRRHPHRLRRRPGGDELRLGRHRRDRRRQRRRARSPAMSARR